MVMATSNLNRLPLRERRKRWVGCFKAFHCFGAKKGERRIVPASRIPEGSVAAGQSNQPQAAGLSNQARSILAPPSSPASFSHSAAPSTAQSPNCLLSLSANSPGGPSSSMFATGPYAHETQLVSPPVFSTFTTEPSTAPLTPPPELAHLTSPSSPDVPYARFLTSANDLNKTEKVNSISANDIHGTYGLYSGGSARSLRSPISRASEDGLSSSFPEREFSPRWDPLLSPQADKYSRSDSSYAQTPETNCTPKASGGSNFFCPATFARYYLDNDAPFSHTGGRLSVSKDSDFYPMGGNDQDHRQTRSISKQDMDELEAYRASFGFSADEVITTGQYVEITNVNDDSMRPRNLDAILVNCNSSAASESRGLNLHGSEASLDCQISGAVESEIRGTTQEQLELYNDEKREREVGYISGSSTPGGAGEARTSRKHVMGLCSSDAEIDYRRSGRSKGDVAWHHY